MARMYTNAECPRRYFGDSSQLTNFILDSGATYHITPDILDFIPGSLVEKHKYFRCTFCHIDKNRRSSNKIVWR